MSNTGRILEDWHRDGKAVPADGTLIRACSHRGTHVGSNKSVNIRARVCNLFLFFLSLSFFSARARAYIADTVTNELFFHSNSDLQIPARGIFIFTITRAISRGDFHGANEYQFSIVSGRSL